MNYPKLKTCNLQPQRIVVVRSLPGLGDLLCAVPAFRALRTAFPQAHITLIGLPLARDFVQRFSHYLDEWLEFPGYPGIPEVTGSPQRLTSFLNDVQQSGFDLALQLHGSGIYTNPFTVLLGARVNAGFFIPGQYCPDSEYFFPYPDDQPEIRRNLQLLTSLGISLQGEELEFPLWKSDWQAFEAMRSSSPSGRIATTHDLQPGRYICIHPGASVSSRRWKPAQFAAVADALAAQGFQIVLTGTAIEAQLTQAVADAMHSPAVDLAGKTSLGAIAALLKQAQLLICNDTGISHLAAALQVKSVVLFSASDPNRWAPLNRHLHRIVTTPQCPTPDDSIPHPSSLIPHPSTLLSHANDLLQELAYAP
ncbi:MAG: glycosyltransferase family 9 protein [Leptolyngbyaceae cyanobacterium SL_5_14]|nr:glycosyltransferase family 9 protein [Leptolyngbyaceae cyanobacterium SL_5_14]